MIMKNINDIMNSEMDYIFNQIEMNLWSPSYLQDTFVCFIPIENNQLLHHLIYVIYNQLQYFKVLKVR